MVIEEEKEVLLISFGIQCQSDASKFYKITAAIALSVWGLGMPLSLFHISRRYVISKQPKVHPSNQGSLDSRVKAEKHFSWRSGTSSLSMDESAETRSKDKVSSFSSLTRIGMLGMPKTPLSKNEEKLGGFLVAGYRNKFYYWESLVYIRKLSSLS